MSKLKGWARNMIFISIFVFIIIVAVFALIRQQSTIKKMQDEIAEKKQELEEVQLDVEGYERMLEFSQSNEYAEQQARKILGWVRDDEILFIDPSTTNSGAVQDNAASDGVIAEAEQDQDLYQEE